MIVKLLIVAAIMLFLYVQLSQGFDKMSTRFRALQTLGIVLLAVAVTIA